MNVLIRPAFAVAIVFALAVCLFSLYKACDPSSLRKFIREDRRRERLLQIQQSSFRHSEAQRRMMREMIARQCSLSEAIARLQELDREWLQEVEREWPDAAIGMSQGYRLAWSDADNEYRIITALASEILIDRPEESAAVLRRLKKDYQQLQKEEKASETFLRSEKD